MKTILLLASTALLLGVGIFQKEPDAPVKQAAPSSSVRNIGLRIQLSGQSLDGAAVEVPVPGAKATVVALTSTTCPLCNKYGPTLGRLEAEFKSRGVQFVYLNPTETEDPAEMRDQSARWKFSGPYLHQPGGRWVPTLQAKTTTEVFLIDAEGRLRYRGAVDDQFGIGSGLPKPRNNFLKDALNSVLDGNAPAIPATDAPGCLLAEATATKAEVPTYHGRIQHLIQKNCMTCHRDGGVAPFSLDGYAAVSSRAKMLEFVVEEGIMPPWYAAKGTGPWANDRSLSEGDKAALREWIAGGMPKGDPKDAPEPLRFVEGWTIGKPDAVFQIPKPIPIQESGVMNYVNVDVPTTFSEDKWVEKIEVVPGDRRAVHHVLVFIRKPGERWSAQQEALAELGGFFGGYVPGYSASIYPAGLAKRLPKGSTLRFQLHYTPYGKASSDQTKIGLVFAKTPVVNEVHTTSLASLRLSIPPGAPNHEVSATLDVPFQAKLLSFLPHMHVRGKAARYELVREGKSRVLLDVPRYDFNWQLNYILKNPMEVKPGDQLKYTAWYDNSAENPNNPDPNRRVGWGAQTYDEMHLGYLEFIVPGEKPGEGSASSLGRGGAVDGIIVRTFRRLDRDQDGFVTAAEARGLWNSISRADANSDGRLSLEEAKTLGR